MEYESNSFKSREDAKTTEEARKTMDKIVTSPVKVKKKNGFAKLFGNIISENAEDVKTRIIKDVVFPAIRKVISDTVDTLLYGDTRRGGTTNASKVSYRSYYDSNRYSEPRTRDLVPARSSFDYDDIVFDNRGEADMVLSTLDDAISEYGSVRVSDLYDCCGISCDYTANKYGWTDLRNAEIVRTRDGYKLRMPRAIALK